MSGDKCYSCNQQLYLHDHVVLKPCQCIVCPKCLLSAHAARGTTLLSCGKCGIKVNAHEFVAISGGGEIVGYGGDTNTLDNEDIYATAAAAIASNNTTAVGGASNEEQQQTSTSDNQEEQTSTKTTSNNKKPRKRYPRPKCKEEGCNNYVQSKGVCIRHGAPK